MLAKKGFIRVIEVVLFSFIVLVVILPNLLPDTKQTEKNNWREVSDNIICNDLLNSVSINDISKSALSSEENYALRACEGADYTYNKTDWHVCGVNCTKSCPTNNTITINVPIAGNYSVVARVYRNGSEELREQGYIEVNGVNGTELRDDLEGHNSSIRYEDAGTFSFNEGENNITLYTTAYCEATSEPNNSLELRKLCLYRSLDKEYFEDLSSETFPPMVDFEYEIKGISGQNISVGIHDSCNLPSEFFSANYPPKNISTNILSIANLLSDNSFDTYIVCGNVNLSDYESNVKNLLRKGKGIVLIRDFTSNPDSLTKEIFQINYIWGSFSTKDLSFNNLSNPNTGMIAKRFLDNIVRIDTSGGSGNLYLHDGKYPVENFGFCVNITGCPNSTSKGEYCMHSSSVKLGVYQIENNDSFDVKISPTASNPRNYTFKDNVPLTVDSNEYTVLSPSSDTTISLVNAKILEEYGKTYETSPRAFWMYDFNKTRDDLKLLLRTGMFWTAGEHHFVFDRDIPEDSSYCMQYYSDINGNKIPYLVKLYYVGY